MGLTNCASINPNIVIDTSNARPLPLSVGPDINDVCVYQRKEADCEEEREGGDECEDTFSYLRVMGGCEATVENCPDDEGE
jgi:hypothetical protein